MNYTDRLENVTILGAAGKMGSGILLLTAYELVRLKHQFPEKNFVVNAMDLSEEGLQGLLKYVEVQAKRVVEKKPEKIRPLYGSEFSDEALARHYVEDVLNVIRPVTSLEAAYHSGLVFEAVSENPNIKVKIFKEINENSKAKPWFFTNTSSIPIHHLDEQADMEGRVLGFHFYNPPAIQRLVEIIAAKSTLPELNEFAIEFARNLKKVIVPSNDFAGFIGNGHFMRDALYGIQQAQKLTSDLPFSLAINVINTISQKYLVRPMGIFQLIDYVGIDVVQYIMQVMNPYLKDEELHSPLLDQLMALDVKGGQNPDGSQKDGFLKYEGGRPVAVFDIETKEYINISTIKQETSSFLQGMPTEIIKWKDVVANPDKEEILTKYFNELKQTKSVGAKLAVAYGINSKTISKKLVSNGVAHNEQDVNTVLLTGFFHAYGPINNYFD